MYKTEYNSKKKMKGFLKMLGVKEWNIKIKRKDLYEKCEKFLNQIAKINNSGVNEKSSII